MKNITSSFSLLLLSPKAGGQRGRLGRATLGDQFALWKMVETQRGSVVRGDEGAAAVLGARGREFNALEGALRVSLKLTDSKKALYASRAKSKE